MNQLIIIILFFTASLAFGQNPVQLLDINPGSGSSDPDLNDGAYINDNTQYIFLADDGVHGKELWITDGTASGTNMIIELITTSSNKIRNLYAFDNLVYFLFLNSNDVYQMWRTDGTEEGTLALFDIDEGIDFPNTKMEYVEFNNELYIGVWRQLIKLNSEPNASTLIYDFGTGIIKRFLTYGDHFYFSANDASLGLGEEFWRSDGTTEGTQLVKDLRFGSASGGVFESIVFNGKMILIGGRNGFTSGYSNLNTLWSSDGTEEGTVQISNTTFLRYMKIFNDKIYITRNYEDLGIEEIWVTDGTPEGTVMVVDTIHAEFRTNTIFNDHLIFKAYANGAPPYVLYAIDANDNILPSLGSISTFTRDLFEYNDTLFYNNFSTDSGLELWYMPSDFSQANLYADLLVGPSGSLPSEFINLNNNMLFRAKVTADNNYEIWKKSGATVGILEPNAIYNATIAPNPAKEYLNISVENNMPFTYRIYNAVGQLVDYSSISKLHSTINIENLELGIYYVSISTVKGIITIKFIVE